jgi:UDP-glucose 4-epimerase
MDFRRQGDPKSLVADSSSATREINWKPQFHKLDTIINSAWRWHNLKGRR